MTKHLFIIPLILLMFSINHSATPDFQCGMTYCGFWQNVFEMPESNEEIDSMSATNIKWLSICIWWFQETETSSTIFPFEEGDEWGTPTDSSIAYLVRYAHSRGFSIMLKPMVDPMNGVWRADINPTNWNLWFDNYRSMIAHYAVLAQNLSIEQFCIGCEYLSSSSAHIDQWIRVIDTTRDLYSGHITYASNWWAEFEFITWFHLLDAIGIDAYFPVSDHSNPTVDELIAGWAPHIEMIETFRDTMGLNYMPVIFTEVGCGSYTGASITPWAWDYTGVEENQQEQADYYEALFQAIYPKPWIKGFFIWAWDNPSTSDYRWGGSEYIYGFTPNGKLAQNIVRNWYSTITEVKKKDDVAYPIDVSVFPNPFNFSCTITLEQEIATYCSPITIEIFDLSGRKVWENQLQTTENRQQIQDAIPENWRGDSNYDLRSTNKFIWSPEPSLKSGLYFVRASSKNNQETIKKIMCIK